MQKTAYEIRLSLMGSEMCIRDSNWAVAQYFLPLVEWLTGPVAFIVFGVFGLIAIGYTKVLVPETMGRSLDEVGEEMKSRYERESAPVKP